jgi:hypothetical protein
LATSNTGDWNKQLYNTDVAKSESVEQRGQKQGVGEDLNSRQLKKEAYPSPVKVGVIVEVVCVGGGAMKSMATVAARLVGW